MEKSQHPTSSIALGPGGQITDCELLERLERTPILKPQDSLKLGIYFSESPSPTNRYLGDALWDSGISRIVVSRPVRLAIWDTFEVDSSEWLDQKWDSAHPDPQGKEDTDNQSFVFARVSGIGMLFEKLHRENGESAFYVLNVSPDPKELPDPEASDLKASTSAPSKK